MFNLTSDYTSLRKECKCGYCGEEGTRYEIKFEFVTESFCSRECADKYCEQYKAKRDGKLIL